MTKELTHRGEELTQLGWSQNDVLRYVELWDYRQRWGAINLERDDRLFLRKAESALPEIKSAKPSFKKPTNQKSYYCRLKFFLDLMNQAEKAFSLQDGSKGVWAILIEEELRAIDYFQPVLGLPDTLKAKSLIPFREEVVAEVTKKHSEAITLFKFDFNSDLNSLKAKEKNTWPPLRDVDDDSYPVLDENTVSNFRLAIRSKVVAKVKSDFPSLKDTDKPAPPEEWIPESIS